MNGTELLEHYKETLGEDLKGEGYGNAEAIVGIDYHSCRLVLSMKKQAEFLMEHDGMTYEGALEFILHNFVGARGEDEPIWLRDTL